MLELVATTIGMGWLAILGFETAVSQRPRAVRRQTWAPVPRGRAVDRTAVRPPATGALVAVAG